MIQSLGFSAASALIAVGILGVAPAHAQQQGQGQPSAVGKASVRTREGAPSIQLTQQQTPVITVVYGPQQSQATAKVVALLSTPEQPQQDKEILFNRADAQTRIVSYEGDATGSQNGRITLIAARGEENAVIEPIAQNEAVLVFGVRKAEPKVAQQPAQPAQAAQQPGQPAQPGAQPGQAQPAAAQQSPEQTAAAAKQAADEAKRKAAEPKPDKYDAIVTVFLTTGR